MSDPWTDLPHLSGEHVTLRPMVRGDRDAIVAAASDGKLWELFYTAVPSEASIDVYLDTAERETAYGRAMPFVVLDAAGKLIGCTRYMRMHGWKSGRPSTRPRCRDRPSTPRRSCCSSPMRSR